MMPLTASSFAASRPATAPLLRGARVILRAHVMADMEALWRFYQTPRATMIDRPQNRTDLWLGFASETGAWPLQGWGAWAIEVDGAFAGQVSLTQPPHFAELELGYLLFDPYEGRGLAQEAAALALQFARDVVKPASLVSYIHARNPRSIALAKRLGGVLDPQAPRHDAEDVVYRYEVTP